MCLVPQTPRPQRFQPLVSQSPFLILDPNLPWLQSERRDAPHCRAGHEEKGLHILPSLACPSESEKWGWRLELGLPLLSCLQPLNSEPFSRAPGS